MLCGLANPVEPPPPVHGTGRDQFMLTIHHRDRVNSCLPHSTPPQRFRTTTRRQPGRRSERLAANPPPPAWYYTGLSSPGVKGNHAARPDGRPQNVASPPSTVAAYPSDRRVGRLPDRRVGRLLRPSLTG